MKWIFARPVVVLAIVVCGAPPSARAAYITPQADAFIQDGDTTGNTSNVNFGSGSRLVVKRNGGTESNRKAYLRFSLAGVQEPIVSASFTLSLAAIFGPSTFSYRVYGLNDGDAGDLAGGWLETGAGSITWNNAPANTNTPNGLVNSRVTDLGSFTVSSTAAVGDAFTLSTPSLLNFLNADTNNLVTLIVVRNEFGSPVHNFYAREAASSVRPTLELNSVTAVPAPPGVVLALAGVGCLALPRLARRRK
jgi:hypothetical protein